jgi:hypothetical protein
MVRAVISQISLSWRAVSSSSSSFERGLLIINVVLSFRVPPTGALASSFSLHAGEKIAREVNVKVFNKQLVLCKERKGTNS